jgi:hypothetical protein
LDSEAKTLARMAYHVRPVQRDPFVRNRSRRSIGKATFCVLLCDMLKSRLILCTRTWWSRWVLLEDSFSSHHGGKTRRKTGPALSAVVDIANRCDVGNGSKWQDLNLG